MIGLLAGLAVAATEPEDELKSATVLSFLRHSEWLQGAATGPITIGVVGRASMTRMLRRTLDGKTANNRSIRIVEAKASAELNSCQVLYVATDNNNDVRQTLAGVRALHALTIGETDRFLEYGGAVNLLIVDGHMSFEVSLEALDRAGVSISAKLLRYGQVKARPPA
ncbi:MAG: YfiR family protein [Candidatus Solibacter sp.]|nr:YfiR family protein [Candidatus Solibacter sp.]